MTGNVFKFKADLKGVLFVRGISFISFLSTNCTNKKISAAYQNHSHFRTAGAATGLASRQIVPRFSPGEGRACSGDAHSCWFLPHPDFPTLQRSHPRGKLRSYFHAEQRHVSKAAVVAVIVAVSDAIVAAGVTAVAQFSQKSEGFADFGELVNSEDFAVLATASRQIQCLHVADCAFLRQPDSWKKTTMWSKVQLRSCRRSVDVVVDGFESCHSWLTAGAAGDLDPDLDLGDRAGCVLPFERNVSCFLWNIPSFFWERARGSRRNKLDGLDLI